MYWAEGTEDPASATWEDASAGAIFDYDNWEPGFVQVRHIKIENKGTLALKYHLMIALADGAAYTDLAKVIDVYFVDPATKVNGRAELVDAYKVGTLADVLAGMPENASGKLLAGANAQVTIALKMQETAGNEYQNMDLAGKFAVKVLATQLDSEEDSFDNTYDEGLTPPELGKDYVLKEENGVQYAYTEEGDNVLYLVTEDYADATYNVPSGVTTVGNYAFAYNNNVKEVTLSASVESLGRGFDSSTVEKVVLNEGLQQIDSRAFRSTTALEEVVISSTVKTIADNAFQKSGIKTLTIPATVETIGETAFGASLIEKVVIEGNTSIQGYAFRGATKLKEVYLNGDDVTFIPSTLNGRNSTWFCNGESNNPGTSHIIFHVKNETVAKRVKIAMHAEKFGAGENQIFINGVEVADYDEL
jgi:hypothetical protein